MKLPHCFHSIRRASLRVLVAAICFAATAPWAIAQDDPGRNPVEEARRRIRRAVQRIAIPKSRLRDGPHVRAAFRDVVEDVSRATVRIKADGKDAALGGIIGPNGWILTKASRLAGDLVVQLRDGRELPAELVGVDDQFDLAMLKVDDARLPTVALHDENEPVIGRWVATPGPQRDPVAVGVVSVGPREIAKKSGVLGVMLEDDADDRPIVVQVIPESGAARAGVLVNDIIVAVNGTKTETRMRLIQRIREFAPDDEVEITVERNGETITLKATLTEQVQGMRFDRGQYQNNMGSRLSRRRYGFPEVFQHDTVLRPEDCGGPIVDLEGRVIGFNLARAGRTESYAVPTSVVVTRLFDLMSGKLMPVSEDEQEVSAER